MEREYRRRVLPLAALVGLGAAGCVSLRKYKALEARASRSNISLRESQTRAQKAAQSLKESVAKEQKISKDLKESQALNESLKKDNENLSTDLAAAKKAMESLVLGLESDLTQAAESLTAAMKLLKKNGSPAHPHSKAAGAPEASVPAAVSPSSAPVSTPASAR